MASAEAVVKLAYELGATVVRPGQTLVVCTPRDLSLAERDNFKGWVEAKLPGVNVCVLVGVSQALVYEPDEVRAVDS